MNPCFITTSFAPRQVNSGISNANFLLTKYLYERKGIRSTVFAPVQTWGSNNEEHDFVSIRRFKTNKLMNFDFSTEGGRKMVAEHKIKKFDIVHSYHYGFHPATAGFKFANKNKIPHFLTAAFHPPSSAFKNSLMKLYNNTQGKRILSGSSAVFPFNQNEKNQLAAYSKGNYEIVPCPVNNEIFHPRKSRFSRKTITYIGTLLPWKGPSIALQIFKQIAEERKDLDFFIIGSGPLESELRKNSGRVKILANMSNEKVADSLAKSDIVVCPTKYESFGSAIAESMMCGTPVISTNVGAVPETVGPGGILVEYGDWKSMQKNITELIDDDPRRRKIAKNAIKHSANYKYEKVSSKIYSVYKEFI